MRTTWPAHTNLPFQAFDLFFRDLQPKERWSETFFTEKEEAYILSVDLPGVKKENLQLEQMGEVLKITALRKDPEREERRIERQFTFPKDVLGQEIQAVLEDGVLTLTFPKRAEAQPRRIEVMSRDSKALEGQVS